MSDNHNITEETGRLIGSNKIEGTAVYDPQGKKLGSVYNFMVDKQTGHVEYAVLSFGGFLGIGDEYHPLPWDQLRYDVDKGGYVVGLTREQLEGGPRYRTSDEPAFDRTYGEQIDGYYGSPYPR